MIFLRKRYFCILCKNYKDIRDMHVTHDKIAICKHCYDNIEKLKDNCFEGPGNIKAVFSLLLYKGDVRKAVKEYKFSGQWLYGNLFGEMLADGVSNVEVLRECDYIVPVPLHPDRFKERGYNQSEIIAKALSEKLGIPMMSDILFRKRKTERQSSLKGFARIENVKNAFVAYSESVINKKIILVDDICTMGETLKACATALKEGGAGDIFAVTLCMSLNKDKYFSK